MAEKGEHEYWGDKHKPFVPAWTNDAELAELADAIVRGASVRHAIVPDLRKLIDAVQIHPDARLAELGPDGKPAIHDPTELTIRGGEVTACDCSAMTIGLGLACRVRFTRDANFERATFTGNAVFGGATFSHDARRATFIHDARGAIFIHDARGATFIRDAGVWGAAFTSRDTRGASFTGAANFERATFTGTADFWRVTFTGAANFERATFTGTADFWRATFTRDADFVGATFTRPAAFGGATFTGTAGFWMATFTRDANFGGATFTRTASFAGATFTGTADFEGATFTRDAYFRNANLEGATFRGHFPHGSFDNAKLANSDFSGANLRGASFFLADISGMNISRATLIRVRGLFGKGRAIARSKPIEEFSSQTARYGRMLDLATWERLRAIGELRMFAISYFTVIAIVLYATFANWTASVRKSARASLAESADDVSQWATVLSQLPDLPLPAHLGIQLLATISLAIAATIYSLRCPSEVMEQSEVRWTRSMNQPLWEYRSANWSRFYTRYLCLLFFLAGGLYSAYYLVWRTTVSLDYLYPEFLPVVRSVGTITLAALGYDTVASTGWMQVALRSAGIIVLGALAFVLLRRRLVRWLPRRTLSRGP